MKKIIMLFMLFGLQYCVAQKTTEDKLKLLKQEILEDKSLSEARKKEIFLLGEKQIRNNTNLKVAIMQDYHIFETPILTNPCINASFNNIDTANFSTFGWKGFGASSYSKWSSGYVVNDIFSGIVGPAIIIPGFKNQTVNSAALAGCGGGAFGGSYHSIVSSGVDANIASLNRSISGNGFRLGNNNNYNGAEIISKTFIVPSGMNKFRFKYALVCNPDNGAPGFFNAKAYDVSGNIISEVTDIGQSSNPFFISSGSYYYRPWHIAELDLSSKIGQQVTVVIMNTDCFGWGHRQYVYLDDFCTTENDTQEGFMNLNTIDSCQKFPFILNGTFGLPNIVGNPATSVSIKLKFYQSGILVGTKIVPSPVAPNYSISIVNSDLPGVTGCIDVVAELSFQIKDMSGVLQTVVKTSGSPLSGFRPGQNNDICFNCQPLCQCGQWGSIVYYLNGVKDRFLCNNSNVINANQGDIFTLAPNYTCIGGTVAQACNAVIKYDVYFPNGGVLLNVNNIKDEVIDSCGDIRIVMKPTCNGVACPPCEFILRVNCCQCLPEIKPTLVWFTGTGIGIRNEMPIKCGETYTNKLECFQPYLLQVQNPCGNNCAADSMITTIQGPSGPPLISYSVGSTSLVANQVGTYTVTIKVKCGGKWCKECKFKFIQTKNCEPPCDNCKDKVSFEFDSGASSIGVQTYPAASTLNATFVLGGGSDTYTNVRANVVDFLVTSDNPACLQCYNTPNQWGSILSGSIAGFTPVVTSYPSVSATNINNNPREIVFNTTAPTAIPMGTNVNLSIKIPGVNPLSCCCIKVVLYIKITYRNNKCEECTKIVRVGLTQCPPNSTDPATGTTGTGFDPDGGHPQFRMHAPNNDDAKILNTNTNNTNNK